MHIEQLVISPEGEDVRKAARSLAENWELPEDVALAAVMTWLELTVRSMLDEPVAVSSVAGYSSVWSLAVEQAQRQKADQIGPWLPAPEFVAEPGQVARPTYETLYHMLGMIEVGRGQFIAGVAVQRINPEQFLISGTTHTKDSAAAALVILYRT